MPQVLLMQALGTESDLALLKGVPTVTLPAAGRHGNSVACGGVRRQLGDGHLGGSPGDRRVRAHRDSLATRAGRLFCCSPFRFGRHSVTEHHMLTVLLAGVSGLCDPFPEAELLAHSALPRVTRAVFRTVALSLLPRLSHAESGRIGAEETRQLEVFNGC